MSEIYLVKNKLHFAKKRLQDLEKLNNGNIANASPLDRQQLIQEFFFHLVGAIDFLIFLVKISKNLSIDIEDVNVREVCKKLNRNDPIRITLEQLHTDTKNRNLPQDPYSEEGCHFRIMLLRNIITHQKNAPFFFKVVVKKKGITTNLFLDPREEKIKGSEKEIYEELNNFWNLVNKKCKYVINLL